MWKESAQKLMREWSKSLRSRMQAKPQKKVPKDTGTKAVSPTVKVSSDASIKAAAEKGVAQAESAYRKTAKAVVDTFREKVASSPSYTSAKEYSSQLRKSSSHYASDISKRLPKDRLEFNNKISEPAQRAIQESLQSAQRQAFRMAQEKIAEPAQKSLTKSAQQVSESVQSASSRVASTASRVAQEQIAQPAQRVLERSSQSAQRVVVTSAESAKKAATQATSAASSLATTSSQTFFQELRSMRRDALWWIWWWSLAAIGVYGVATTLPGELLREYSKNRSLPNNPHVEEDGSARTVKEEGNESHRSTSVLPSGWFSPVDSSSKDIPKSEDSSWWPVLQSDNREDNGETSKGGSKSLWPLLRAEKQDEKDSSKAQGKWSWPIRWSSEGEQR